MEKFYCVLVVVGVILVFLQVLATRLGLLGDYDTDHLSHDHTSDTPTEYSAIKEWFSGLLSFRALYLGLAFYGIGELNARLLEVPQHFQEPFAIAITFSAMSTVAFIRFFFYHKHLNGTARLRGALNLPATVYLRIPAGYAGPGKITLTLQGRTIETEAYTPGPELPTGAPVRVVLIRNSNSVDVLATDPNRNSGNRSTA
ncbi:MAG: hypothetical protein ACRCZF_06575 [Gemmataceae bacterium]